MQQTDVDRPTKILAFSMPLLGFVLAACQQTPSISEVTEACKRGNAAVTSIEFGKAYTSAEPEKISGVPPNVMIYPVKVTYEWPALSGRDSRQTVDRNVYTNLFGELVCD